VFIGYSKFQKGYRCYDPQTQKLHVTLDASFHETEPYYSGVFLALLFRGRLILKRMVYKKVEEEMNL
jgi:hypothetical protein